MASAPEIVVIGAMKCATTTLHHHLEKHPDVCASDPKEIDFFCRDEKWARGSRWYDQQFPGWSPGQLRLDSSPNYSKRHIWPRSAERIAQSSPQARLIFIVREPIDRMKSGWVHSVAAGRDHLPLEQLARDPNHDLIEVSRYYWQLEPFLERFDHDQLLVMRFDEVVGRPEAALHRAFAHCGLSTIEVSGINEVQNSSRDKTRPTELARRLPWKRSRGVLRRISPRLAERRIDKPTLSTATEQYLRNFFAPDLEALQATGLVDVSDWLPAPH